MAPNNAQIIFGIFLSVIVAASALHCYQCGQYNDGVGSITPCINETLMKLKECPSQDHVYCIKYISEGSTVKDCVPKCTDREDWGTRTYCCTEDGCNSAWTTKSPTLQSSIIVLISIVLIMLH